MIIKKMPFNTMAVCATLGRLGQKKLYIKKQPQIAAIKSDTSKIIRTVLGFIIVRKGLAFANLGIFLWLCKSSPEDSAHRMVGCGP